MPDYKCRAEEMLSDLESLQPAAGENSRSTHRAAIERYMQTRNDVLNSLLETAKDNSPSNTENASRWTSLCQAMAEGVDNSFRDEIRILATIIGPGALALGAQAGRAVQDEKQFFASLSNVNAAAVRDYLVGNAQELGAFTEEASKLWEGILEQAKASQEDEKSVYDEVLNLVSQAVRNLAEEERTFREKAAEVSAKVFDGIGKLADIIEFLTGLPEGTAILIEKAMEFLTEKTEEWVAWNRYLEERIGKYLSLVQEQKSGVLPIFKDCREKVYEYWNEKGTKTSRVWLDTARSSLDSWKSSCPTSGQRDDADRFSADVYGLIQEHWKAVEAVGKAFEERWSGVFQGALQPTTQDKLTESIAWKQNADALIGLHTDELSETFLKDSDEIYGSSFSEPISKLREAAQALPDENEHKREAVEAVVALEDKIRSEFAERLKALQEQVDKARKRLQPEAIQKVFDRSELEDFLRD